MQAVCGTDRGFLTFAVCLPVADKVGQSVSVGFDFLLTLGCAPNTDIVTDKPLHNKGSFIRNTAYAVKHKYKQNIKFALGGILFDKLYFVPVCCPDFVTGNTFLLQFTNDSPAHLLGKTAASLSLHRNVRFVILGVVKLLPG